MAQLAEPLDQSDRGGGLPFAEGRGGDGGDVDVLADRTRFDFGQHVEMHFGFVRPEQDQIFAVDTEPLGDFGDWTNGGGLGDV